jgi:hypothetical protein
MKTSQITLMLSALALVLGCSGTDGRPGDAGAPGAEGNAGPRGNDGKDGHDGKDGRDGKDGQDGKDGREGLDPRVGPQCELDQPGHAPESGASIAGEIEPAPASIGADVPVTYFGPPPSSVNPNLVGPLQLLSAGSIDFEAGTITLPLYKGKVTSSGLDAYYVLTDVSDLGLAQALGLNYSAKLKFANVPARQAHGSERALTFDNGTVDFTPEYSLTPGAAPKYFPPTAFQPGSVGDADYTPLVYVADEAVVFNAPIIAYGVTDAELDFCDGAPDYSKVHDKVVAICPEAGTVTLKLTSGFSFGKPVLYLSTDASVALAATLENATVATALERIKTGGDDGAFSAVERLFSFTNGPMNVAGKGQNPQRQGLNSAIHDGGGPLNVLGGIPHVATDYSPLWDFHLGEWTAEAIAKGYRSRLNEEFQILGFVKRGFVTGPGGGPWGTWGIIVDCPIVHRFL